MKTDMHIWKPLLIRTIKDIMQERHMSRKEMAMMIGISESQLSRLLKGRRNPTMKTVLKLAYAFRIKPSRFVIFREMFE